MLIIVNVMSERTIVLGPAPKRYLRELGENIKLARLRRRLTMKLVCERAFVSRTTLTKIEKGDPTVSIGAYAAVLHALQGLDKDLAKVALEEEWARTMMELGIKTKQRGKR